MRVFRTLWVRITAVLLLLAFVVAGLLWLERKAVAKRFADGELAALKVRASYNIVKVSFNTQRIENLIIGDPANPDLTAKWAEIDVNLALSGTAVTAIRARGVRIKARLEDGKVSFGAVDKLLPAPTGKPFALPDMVVDVSDTRLSLATPYGQVGSAISGEGNLANGFLGKVAVAMPTLSINDCAVDQVTGAGTIDIKSRMIGFTGPVRANQIKCGKMTARTAMLMPEFRINESFDQWKGKAFAQVGALDAPAFTARATQIGNKSLSYAVSGSGTFDGNATQTLGSFTLTSNLVSAPRYGEGAFAMRAGFIGSLKNKTISIADGLIQVPRVSLARSALVPLNRLAVQAKATPAAPITNIFFSALNRTAQSLSASASFGAFFDRSGGTITARNFSARGNDGASLTSAPSDTIIMRVPSGRIDVDARLTLAGNAQLPRGEIRLVGNDRGMKGRMTLLPYRVGATQLTLSPVNFETSPRGWSVQTQALFAGPLDGGSITGLRVPVSLRNGQMTAGCLPVSFQQLALSGITLAQTSLGVCLSGSTAMLGATKTSGKVGGTPITLSASDIRIGLSNSDFRVSNMTARLGSGTSLSELSVASLTGIPTNGGLKGSFEAAAGTIGVVPLLLSEGGGTWQLNRGALSLAGGVRVADRDISPRFFPLVSKDLTLRFENNLIAATGTLLAPKTETKVAVVALAHDLKAQTGHADLLVEALRFGNELQPETLTPITLGVIANVFGSVGGAGRINWTKDGVTSTGSFSTEEMNFAAAFGPVSGLKGQIALSDLLGLETPSGQSVRIASINPGIAVLNGDIKYQLLPGLKVQIEGGRWPFSGGNLILEPTTLDLSEAAVRRLTFRVEGMDAAQFINQLEFENIAATGIFDGTLPMIFDKSGGRIEGGSLVARSGGTLSYVGEISNENLGTMGQFAFDALKSIKYDRLAIELGGAIDGDIVTKVKFAGVNQAPVTAKRTRLPIRIVGISNIPFIFNVTITAPFRQLFETTKSLQDPSILIERMVPQLQTPKPPVQTKAKPSVQTKESEPVR